MKRIFLVLPITLIFVACGGASEEQTKAAKELCDCIEKAEFGDFDIDYYECNIKVEANYPGETFADEGFSEALEENCPEVAAKITEE
ncbi:hypothetical protein K6119_05035 [Paracrocinitomix mangrovi]|uniref:hypothetical protein n=1 Tax=Paracrocinitomix mangrovi TaxID=2862509 RepID=UPI001C8DD13B|nr:hypothetical protein [Paracrocinitomix mangrovi]UKN02877.1 hypothetical protein K6119_05035 [Paracrocinitomix mangrovi]